MEKYAAKKAAFTPGAALVVEPEPVAEAPAEAKADPINPKRGPGRPRKVAPPGMEHGAPQLTDIPGTAYTLTHMPAEQAAHAKPIGTLYIQAMPLNDASIVHAHTLITKAAETARNDLHLHHILLAEYSTGGASLAAQLRADILAGPRIENLVLMNRAPEGRHCEVTLCELAERVVVGL